MEAVVWRNPLSGWVIIIGVMLSLSGGAKADEVSKSELSVIAIDLNSETLTLKIPPGSSRDFIDTPAFSLRRAERERSYDRSGSLELFRKYWDIDPSWFFRTPVGVLRLIVGVQIMDEEMRFDLSDRRSFLNAVGAEVKRRNDAYPADSRPTIRGLRLETIDGEQWVVYESLRSQYFIRPLDSKRYLELVFSRTPNSKDDAWQSEASKVAEILKSVSIRPKMP